MLDDAVRWMDRLDPGAHRRVKGLRLVTAFGIAALGAAAYGAGHDPTHVAVLVTLAGGFALWASVSEGQATRRRSARDLAVLVVCAMLGAVSVIGLTPLFSPAGVAGPELVLVSGAFLVGYMKRFGTLGAGVGSQVFIGQLLAYASGLTLQHLALVLIAGVIAAVAAIVPRLLSGPSEHPVAGLPMPPVAPRRISAEMAMGLQAATAALVIVLLNAVLHIEESAWAITACAYVVAGSTSATIHRVLRRIGGTAIGVPLGLVCLPLSVDAPVLVWSLAALAMIIYAMSLPERYDIACGAYAFTLIVTLAASGEHSVALLAARLWETLLGGFLGVMAALFVLPLRPVRDGAAAGP